MSLNVKSKLSFNQATLTKQFETATKADFLRCLEEGMHGLCMSPYEEGQRPGDVLTEAQLRRRLSIIQPFSDWVRSFSCTEGNELIPRIARELGMKTMVGAWLGTDSAKNEAEIAGLIELAQAGYVDIAAVGNEVLYRDDMSLNTLLSYIRRVQTALPDVAVGYVDAYYEFADHPALVDACDIVLANCYPYWEKCTLEYSLSYLQQMHQRAVGAAKGKPVVITETGWPSQGTALGGAVPSEANAINYFVNVQDWAREAQVDVFYFSSFDEGWKEADEGDVGAYWGLWDKYEQLKYI